VHKHIGKMDPNSLFGGDNEAVNERCKGHLEKVMNDVKNNYALKQI